jgi:hypothetical protein
MMTFESLLTCPTCGYATTVTMPTDRCIVRYTCQLCRAELRPHDGHCCVFCSFGSVPCPPIQREQK